MSFWENWRKELHEHFPEQVRPEYTNLAGIWHRDFIRDKPGQDEHGVTRYPSEDFVLSATGAWGGFNKMDLIRRGWTRTSIKRILGEPDRRMVRKDFRKDRPECVYEKARVEAAEAAGAIRYREAGGHLKRLPFDPNLPAWIQLDECRRAFRTRRPKQRN